jgi:hypothetical protein
MVWFACPPSLTAKVGPLLEHHGPGRLLMSSSFLTYELANLPRCNAYCTKTDAWPGKVDPQCQALSCSVSGAWLISVFQELTMSLLRPDCTSNVRGDCWQEQELAYLRKLRLMPLVRRRRLHLSLHDPDISRVLPLQQL